MSPVCTLLIVCGLLFGWLLIVEWQLRVERGRCRTLENELDIRKARAEAGERSFQCASMLVRRQATILAGIRKALED